MARIWPQAICCRISPTPLPACPLRLFQLMSDIFFLSWPYNILGGHFMKGLLYKGSDKVIHWFLPSGMRLGFIKNPEAVNFSEFRISKALIFQ